MRKDKKFWIYGRKPVEEYLKEGGQLEKLYLQSGMRGAFYDRIIRLAKASSTPVQSVPRVRLDKLHPKNHQGILGLKSAIQYQKIEQVLPFLFEQGVVPVILVCDGITDVRNFGAIARSAEVLGAHVLVIPATNSAQVHADAIKTSAGALLRIPVCRVRSLLPALDLLHQSGLQIVMSDVGAKADLQDVDFSGPVAILLGSEEKGIHPSLVKHADTACKIPQAGQTDSLNVSVAAGIILYEVGRQRKTNTPPKR